MVKNIYLMAAVCMLVAILAGEARCEIFRYVDDKGVVHVTDNYANVPEKYRKSTERVNADNRTSGYTPSIGTAIGSEQFSADAWFDYGKMPFYERWYLLARAGFVDIVPILKAMGPWAGLATFIFLSVYFIVFKVLEVPAKRVAVMTLVFVILAAGLFYKYIDIVKDHSSVLLQKVRHAGGMSTEHQQRTLGVLDAVSGEGR